MNELSIPIIVDDRKDLGKFQMTRATYYYVESIEPFSGESILQMQDIELPLMMLELSGVIFRPVNDDDYFRTPDQVEKVFRFVEDHEGLYVGSDHIWIPNELFYDKRKRGDVCRISESLFRKLYLLCRDNAVADLKPDQLGNMSPSVSFSEVETDAFDKWGNSIIEDVKAEYKKNEKLRLEWRD